MSKHLQRDMESLEQHLLSMSSMVEEMIESACRGLISGELSTVSELFEQERAIDEMEVGIEEECLKILALHQPVASDLRRVTTLLKINNELERIADLAVNITQRSLDFSDRPELPKPAALRDMSHKTVWMVRTALDSFVREDVEAARQVMSADEEVDALNREVIAGLRETMAARSDLVDAALHCFSASRHIERIADHATNIAEDVVYLVMGEIARHNNRSTP